MPKVVERKPQEYLQTEIARLMHESAIDFAREQKLDTSDFPPWEKVSPLNKKKYEYVAIRILKRLGIQNTKG